MKLHLQTWEKLLQENLLKKHRPLGLEQNKKFAQMGGYTVKVAKEELEKNLGESVVSKNNSLSYEYIEEDFMIENKEL